MGYWQQAEDLDSAEAVNQEPRRTRGGRAVIHVSLELIHSLLLLPDDMDVLYVAPDNYGNTMAVVVEADYLPHVEEGAMLHELAPEYEVDSNQQLQLATLGLPNETAWTAL